MMKENPMWNFSSRCASKNAQGCIKLVGKFCKLKRSRPHEITTDLVIDIRGYLEEAARELEKADVRMTGEKKLVKVAQIGIRNCIRNLI